MRSLGERLNLLRTLINLQCGPGAAILPPDVTRIHMDFAFGMKGGHMGPRKFWRECLPRLKYHNPSIPMIVNRHDQNAQPPIMTIYFRKSNPAASSSSSSSSSSTTTSSSSDAASSSSSSPPDDAAASTPSQPASSRTNLSKAQPPNPDERAVHIDMTNKHSSLILDSLMAETRAVPLQPSTEQITEMQNLEALRKQAVVDRERVTVLRAEKKKEEDMLKRARAAGGMAEQEAA